MKINLKERIKKAKEESPDKTRSRIPSRIKDTNHMLNIIDNLNSLDLPLSSILVSFDIINIFQII